MNVTTDEILAAIREAIGKLPASDGPDGITTSEFAEKFTDGNDHKARADILRLLRAGALVPLKVYRISEYTGYRVKVPGFRPA